MLDWLGVKTCHTVRHRTSDENPIRASGVLDEVKKAVQKVV